MAIDKEAVKYHIKGLLKALGDDPEREGLKETPDRVARMYEEIFEGMNYTNSQIAEMFSKTFEDDYACGESDMVLIRDIEVFSFCEHHMALMYDMKVSIAYIPNGKGNRTFQGCKNCRYGGKKASAPGTFGVRYS